MACMCGDSQCPSCGPAQGNSQCPICRAWADDGCDHIDEETGEIKEKFKPLAEEAARRESMAEQEMAEEIFDFEQEEEKYQQMLDDEKKKGQ